jgi:hypothetical protein
MLKERIDIVTSYMPNFNPNVHGEEYAYFWLRGQMWKIVCELQGIEVV